MGDFTQGAIEPLLPPENAAKILNLSISWLAKSRMKGEGPEFVKIGRVVRYSESGLRKFIKAQTHTPTSDGEADEKQSTAVHHNT
jgi:hypothetical protein